jgi:AcrR family transcriptional regulator
VNAITRDEILDTALQLFTAQGYEATSLRQIADRLGFTKAALYYHFPAKDHLIIELSRPWLDAISNLLTLQQQEPAERHEDEHARRTALLSRYIDVSIAYHPILRLLSSDAATQKHPDVGKRARTLIAAMQDAVAGPEAGDADRIRTACAFAVVHAVAPMDPSMLAAARPIVASAAAATLRAADT